MTVRRAVTPDGTEWVVRRRWVPAIGRGLLQFRGRRTLTATADAASSLGDLADIPVVGIAFAVPAIVAFVALMMIGIPLLAAFLAGLLVAAVLTATAAIGRILLRQPWQVEAVSTAERRTWHVVGFRAAGQRRDELVEQFRRGNDPQTVVSTSAT